MMRRPPGSTLFPCATLFRSEGGALSAGKWAPSLRDSNELEIYTAMLSGPENMPVFGDNQLTPEEKRSIINYVRTVSEMEDRSEEHTSELQSRQYLVCRLLLE